MREHRRLAAVCLMVVEEIPNRGSGNTKSSAGFRNADAGIVVDEPARRDCGEQSSAFFTVGRLGRETRGRAGKFSPGHFPQIERRLISEIKNRIGFCAVRDKHESGIEYLLRKFCIRKFAGQQVTARPMFEAARNDLNLRDDG